MADDRAPTDRAYLDNAATSFPKPPRVHEAMLSYATSVGASPGRGAYAESREGAARIDECRSVLCELINAPGEPERLVFTLNATDALNLAIKGVVRHRQRHAPDRPVHVVTTAMDHNSVLRPLNELADEGVVEWSCVPADPVTGLFEPDAVAGSIRPDTALVAVCHASNVSGSLQPLAEIGRVCRGRAPLLVDAAQSMGHLPIDVRAMGIDLLAFPGHKGLLGPLGTGGLWLGDGMPEIVETLREGGTGSRSESDRQPRELPDRYEPGSHNTPGIVGLAEGVRHLLDHGIERVQREEAVLCEAFLELMPGESEGYRLLGPQGLDDRVGVFSFSHERLSPDEIARLLEERFGVLGRAGLHCAPRAHETFGTHESGGSFRLSIGPATTHEHVRRACRGLREVAGEAVAAMGG